MLLETEHRLLLDAGHDEYTFGGPDVIIRAIWTPLEGVGPEEWTEESAARALELNLPNNSGDFGTTVFDPAWCTVILACGTLKALSDAWDGLLADVSTEPSGDDDAYDYWPSGCRLLMAMASDLDELDEGHRKEHAVEAIERVLEAKGPEFRAEVDYKVGLR